MQQVGPGVDLGPDVTVWVPGQPPWSPRSGNAGTDGLLIVAEVARDLDDRAGRMTTYAAVGIPAF